MRRFSFPSTLRLHSVHKLIVLLGHLQLITLSWYKAAATGWQELPQGDHPLRTPGYLCSCSCPCDVGKDTVCNPDHTKDNTGTQLREISAFCCYSCPFPSPPLPLAILPLLTQISSKHQVLLKWHLTLWCRHNTCHRTFTARELQLLQSATKCHFRMWHICHL